MTVAVSQYITPLTEEEEWRILITLAQAPSPSDACRTANWRQELFSHTETQEVFIRLSSAQHIISLPLPQAFDGLTEYTRDELRSMRQRMAYIAVFTRLLPTYQSNLRERLLAILDARVANDSDIEHWLTSMFDVTLTGMDTSVETLKALLSPTRETVSLMTQHELDEGYWNRIRAMRAAAPTGFSGLNRILSGGLHPERFFVILGAPGAGKTTFANQIAEYVASRGRPTVYLACEESPATLYAKTLARLGNVDYAAVQFGWTSHQSQIDAARFVANQRLSATRLLYIEGFTGLPELRAAVQQHFHRFSAEEDNGGPGLLIVDYLQCIAQISARMGSAGANLSENQLISLLCYDLRAVAKDFNCTVIAISRQNRASGYGNSNALTSGSGSGGIEYGADVVMSIDKDEERAAPIGWKGRVLFLPKNRLGEADTRLAFDWRGSRQEFRETNREENDNDR